MPGVELFESRHLREPGFFRFLFRALRDHGGAAVVSEERPVPRDPERSRGHEGACIRMNDTKIFVDMSDHVFDFDFAGLRWADCYLKANLNREVAARVLGNAGLEDLAGRLRPFCFFPPALEKCALYRRFLGPLAARLPGSRRFCHIVGVYQNPLLDNRSARPPFGERIEGSVLHFWIRKAFAEALEGGDSGRVFSRLTSRGIAAIEDRRVVHPNVNHWAYLWKILTSDFLVLNTFPHAVYPWKAFEALALGRPFVLEREPLIEIPEAFRPVSGVHFLEVLPGFGSFDAAAPLDDQAAYRVLDFPEQKTIAEGFARVFREVGKPETTARMRRDATQFARERLAPGFLCSWMLNLS